MFTLKLASVAALFATAGCACLCNFNPDENCAVSPDGKNQIRLYSSPLAYEVVRDGVVVVPKTEIGMKVDGKAGEKLAFHMAPGGGFVVKFTK